MTSNKTELAQKRLFTAISIITGISVLVASIFAVEFGDIYIRAISIAVVFCTGYFTNYFQQKL